MHRGGATTMIIVLGLWLALLLPNAAAQEGEKCVSEMHGDFAYKTCASFCKVQARELFRTVGRLIP
eukprot:1651274-Pleurochrysis_carterae.AAC.3